MFRDTLDSLKELWSENPFRLVFSVLLCPLTLSFMIFSSLTIGFLTLSTMAWDETMSFVEGCWNR